MVYEMKKQYLITREQLDTVIDNYLKEKMEGAYVTTINNPYAKETKLNAFINPDDEVLFILFEWSGSWDDDDEGPKNELQINKKLVDFFMTHLSIRKHKAIDIISDWFQDTYDYDFDDVGVGDSLRGILSGWSK